MISTRDLSQLMHSLALRGVGRRGDGPQERRVRQQVVLRIGVAGDAEPAARLIEQTSFVEKV
ncbi:MAG: hypothetical protein DCC67_20395, partial [Planctomycetota bacterium]